MLVTHLHSLWQFLSLPLSPTPRSLFPSYTKAQAEYKLSICAAMSYAVIGRHNNRVHLKYRLCPNTPGIFTVHGQRMNCFWGWVIQWCNPEALTASVQQVPPENTPLSLIYTVNDYSEKTSHYSRLDLVCAPPEPQQATTPPLFFCLIHKELKYQHWINRV